VTLLPFSSATVEIAHIHGTAIELKAEQEATYSYFQDGKFLFNIELGPRPTLLPVAPDDFDGRIHHVALRDKYGIFTQAEDYILLPASLTPYDLLQRETTPPIPSYLAPSARFRYLALKKHIEASAGAHSDLAAVARAHQILERGFDGLAHFAPIALNAPSAPDVSVIIPVHNKFNVTYYCLCALIVAANKASFEVIIADDGSTDNTLDIGRIAAGVRVVRNEKPEGFVAACNMGAAAAKGKYLVFLNNDTEPTVGWLDELLTVFRTFESVGLVGSKLLYPNGRLQEAGGIVWRTGNPWNYGRSQNPWDPKYCYVRQVDYVSGAALMMPTGVWKEVGGFSDEFRPAYFEDTDLAFKVRAAGYKTYLAPHSIVYHFEGLSSGTDVSSGMKRFQEINRPKFKKKWAAAFRHFGEEGISPDLEKDRGISGRIAFIDYTTPRPDFDAGSYAAVQEMKLVQALGFKVTFVADNVAFLGRYTEDLQRLGIEAVCAPFVLSLSEFIEKRGQEFQAFYVTRYNVAKGAIPLVRRFAPHAKIILNLADLHFLRELRAGIASRNRQQIDNAVRMRDEELSIMRQTDVALSYNSVEHAVILSHNLDSTKVMTCPWVVEVAEDTPTFAEREGIAFIGSYSHPPNVEAVEFFVQQVMPLLRGRLPKVAFHVYGTKVPASLKALARDDVVIEGYVENLSDVFGCHRIFVAPLLSGAGIKGKVLSAMSYGAPSVLSPVAAEGIAMVPGTHGIIAKTPAEWVEGLARLYEDEKAWNAMSESAKKLMRETYSFANGVETMREAFHAANIY
jgi:GT2 family glycosyltransferase/glycosyltransferase involved in cell wall biosynthesis